LSSEGGEEKFDLYFAEAEEACEGAGLRTEKTSGRLRLRIFTQKERGGNLTSNTPSRQTKNKSNLLVENGGKIFVLRHIGR